MASRKRTDHTGREASEPHVGDEFLEQAGALSAMFKKDAERFKKEPVTQKLAGLAYCYWSQYPLWLNMMGICESKQRVPQSIHNAKFALDHAHRLAMRVLSKFAASRGVDLSSALSIETAGNLCREMYHDDFERYIPHGAQCDQWPLSLGAELLKLPPDQRQTIQTATAAIQQIDVLEFVAGSNTTEAAADDSRKSDGGAGTDGKKQKPLQEGQILAYRAADYARMKTKNPKFTPHQVWEFWTDPHRGLAKEDRDNFPELVGYEPGKYSTFAPQLSRAKNHPSIDTVCYGRVKQKETGGSVVRSKDI